MPNVYRNCPSCGAEMKLFVTGNRRDAERKADWMLNNGHVCDDCLQASREAENAKAAEANQALPKLQGSEKQIAWAETIRRQHLDVVEESISIITGFATYDKARQAIATSSLLPKMLINDTVIAFHVSNEDSGFAQLKSILFAIKEVLSEQVKSSWWIDGRNASSSWILGQLKEQIAKRLVSPVTTEQEELERDVLAEATVYPSDPVSKVVAVVSGTEKVVTISYPEKNESLRQLAKRLDFQWVDGCWMLKLNATHGQPTERLAESAHTLLAAGFPVMVLDDDARAKAISGEFEPRWPRWISRVISGKFTGMLLIRSGVNDDLVAEIRSLPGAKRDYYKPDTWYARPCEWQALRDFAQLHDFRITPAAELALAEAEGKEKSALLCVEVGVTPKAQPLSMSAMSKIEGGIADELRDDE